MQINLKLLNDIIAFAISAAKATYAQKEELRRLCLFLLSISRSDAEAMQRDYGFLYLGELLGLTSWTPMGRPGGQAGREALPGAAYTLSG